MFKKIRRKYDDLRFGKKLLVIFVITSIIPIALMQIYHYSQFRKNMMNQINNIIESNLVQIAERTNLTLANYTHLLYQIYVDEEMTEYITMEMSGTAQRKAVAISEIRDRLHQYTSVVDGVRCITLVCTNGDTISYDYGTDSTINTLWKRFSDMRVAPPYMDAKNAARTVITPTMKFEENGEYKYYFHISKRMFDFDHLEKGSIATLILTIDERVLDSICNTEESVGNGINFIISEEGKYVSYPVQSYIAAKADMDIEKEIRESGYLSDSKKISKNSYEDAATGWTFINAYDRNEIFKEVNHSQMISLFFCLVILGAVLMIIFYTTDHLNRSVVTVVTAMRRVEEGDLDQKALVKSRDEIGDIAESFNLMTERIKTLITEVGEAKDRQRNAEIKALEAQINPHFLYNTLDSINWMAIENGQKEISKALINLAAILRYTVSRSNALTTVKEEAEFLQKYLLLQSVRYEGVFDFEVLADRDTERIEIHKLMIQPFVENALIHGFEGIEHGGMLKIHIDLSESKEYLEISIEDNGNGFETEMLEIVNDREKILKYDNNERMGIGMQNALSRLVMYYGEEAHWTVNSVKSIGTEVILYIPSGIGENSYEGADS